MTQAIQTIRRDRRLLADAMEAHKHLQHLTRRLDRGEVIRRMKDLLLHFGPPKLDGEMIDEKGKAALDNAWADSWTRLLRPLTPEALSLAVERWMQGGKPFWPKPTELIALGRALSEEQHKLAWRVQKACEEVPKRKPPPTAEEKAATMKMLEEYNQARAAKAKTMPDAFVPRKPNEGLVSELVKQGLQRRPEGEE